MHFEQELDLSLRARCTLLVVVTVEEERVLEAVRRVCEAAGRRAATWDVADGFRHLGGVRVELPAARDPVAALEAVEALAGDAVVVLKDFHAFWTKPSTQRKLRNLAHAFRASRKSLVVVTPSAALPAELRNEAVVLELPRPTADDLDALLSRLLRDAGGRVGLTGLGREKLAQGALGLTLAQAQRVFARSIVSNGRLDDRDIERVHEEKKLIIRESEALEFYAVHETLDDVGGLEALKAWLELRVRAFTHEARRYGLPVPKGLALIGIPGTGKSLTAKRVAGLWRLPLLRLDAGALFGSYVGESEARTRRAIRLAETVAPCVLWIDELEKAFSAGHRDGGTGQRVFGAILTWMQEKTAPVFVVATANEVDALPPEVLRRGRFDEIFFLDLPTARERVEILAVHLRKRGRLPEVFDLPALAARSAGYTGAELEQAIVDAMYVGFDAGREFTTDDVAATLDLQVPLSVARRENVEALRAWMREGRARPASIAEPAAAPVRATIRT